MMENFIKHDKKVNVVQLIREAETLDDALKTMNGLAANGWLRLWDGATHDDSNWSCATLGMLRDLVYEGNDLPGGIDYQYCDDTKYATINVHNVDGVDGAMALWVCWYKGRGATDKYTLLFDDKEPRPATEQEILKIVEHYSA